MFLYFLMCLLLFPNYLSKQLLSLGLRCISHEMTYDACFLKLIEVYWIRGMVLEMTYSDNTTLYVYPFEYTRHKYLNVVCTLAHRWYHRSRHLWPPSRVVWLLCAFLYSNIVVLKLFMPISLHQVSFCCVGQIALKFFTMGKNALISYSFFQNAWQLSTKVSEAFVFNGRYGEGN